MEIERKFLIDKLPEDLEQYKVRKIEQAYLCTSPVVRIRREDDSFYQAFADEIGADAYTTDAASAANKAKELVEG